MLKKQCIISVRKVFTYLNVFENVDCSMHEHTKFGERYMIEDLVLMKLELLRLGGGYCALLLINCLEE